MFLTLRMNFWLLIFLGAQGFTNVPTTQSDVTQKPCFLKWVYRQFQNSLGTSPQVLGNKPQLPPEEEVKSVGIAPTRCLGFILEYKEISYIS